MWKCRLKNYLEGAENKMAVRHILRDGRVLSDIRGHVVKFEDAVNAYKLMERINEKENAKGK